MMMINHIVFDHEVVMTRLCTLLVTEKKEIQMKRQLFLLPEPLTIFDPTTLNPQLVIC
jgi:hypothetical protein